MKVALVVQRYGADINGGAEQHARYIAEHLARHVEVEVLTTCASDYITWRNERPAGVEVVHGVPVRRFPVSREREPAEFAQWSDRVFNQHALGRGRAVLARRRGADQPGADRATFGRTPTTTTSSSSSASATTTRSTARGRCAGKAILVPTAERDGALGLGLFQPIFRGVRALMYNSYEERALIHAVVGQLRVPGVVVGIGSDIPE